MVRYTLKVFHFLARPVLMFFALPWLMVLLVLGTVAQRYIGLYASQKLFFGSFVLWAGYIPLPGAYATLALIALSLIAKLLLKSQFKRAKAGTLLVHISAIVLLLGGIVTAIGREDGYMVLGDGDASASVSDYRQRELTVFKNTEIVKSLPLVSVPVNAKLEYYGLPFAITISDVCFPCGLATRTHSISDARGLAQKAELARAPYSKDDAQNLSGVSFSLDSTSAGQDGSRIAFERIDAHDTVIIGKDNYTFAVKPVQRPLPFGIRLVHFSRTDYPGTDEARAYRSDVTVKDNGLEWTAAIEMNQPLRYKGYTLYQSSYVDDDGRLMSVLAVVKNAGVWFPYISITMLCVGLALHLVITLRRRQPA